MKRTGNLYEKIAEPENLALAFWKAQRGKRARADVFAYRENLSENLSLLRSELLAENVPVGNYHYFKIYDPKERVICAADFRERVLHHAIINVCEPVFERFQIFDSYACRKGKGLHACIARARDFCRKNEWFLKLDVHKFFDSVNHFSLKEMLARLFKDEALLQLFGKIIDSYEVSRERGLPIGNLTSQFFANMYLGALDHYIKEKLHARSYVRYMDDFVLFSKTKRELRAWRACVVGFLSKRLWLSLNVGTFNRSARGFSYLGQRVGGS